MLDMKGGDRKHIMHSKNATLIRDFEFAIVLLYAVSYMMILIRLNRVFDFCHYVNVSVLITFLQKTSVFYLNYHKFSIKSYVLGVY